MANQNRTVIYVGVTSNLNRRVYEHKEGIGSKFTTKYNCKYLIYYEFHEGIESAILREKQIKRWKRSWKIKLINSINPGMEDWSSRAYEME